MDTTAAQLPATQQRRPVHAGAPLPRAWEGPSTEADTYAALTEIFGDVFNRPLGLRRK